MTSQPSFSAASTTPRKTALSPGQSPPLVRTPIRGFMFVITKILVFDHPSKPAQFTLEISRLHSVFVFRLAPYTRGEDEGEGFDSSSGPGKTLTLPLSLTKGEAALRLHSNPLIHARENLRLPNRIRAFFLDRPDDRQRPIGRIAASRAAKAQSLH